MTIVNNFTELMEARGMGADCTPYYWGRCLYKYTDCGPWTVFLVQKSPAQHITETAIVKADKDGAPVVSNAKTLTEDFRFFLCCDEKGRVRNIGSANTDVEKYKHLMRDYVDKEKTYKNAGVVWTLRHNADSNAFYFHAEYDRPAVLKEVYYETDQASELPHADIVGIKVGSIVEGSDVYVDPQTLMFPFNADDLDKLLSEVDDEASYYWERDNSDWFVLTSPKGTMYPFHANWDEVKWDSKAPRTEVREQIKKWVEEYYPGIWKSDNHGAVQVTENEVAIDFPPRKGWKIMQYCQDCVY